MSDDLRAAAKRLLHRATEDGKWEAMEEDLYQAVDDGAALAISYLAEHSEDDDELVTEEWLRNYVGWIPVEGSGYIGCDKVIFCKGSESVYSAWLKISQYYYDMRRIVRVETRGDVRRLCAALGIELKGAMQ